MSFLDFEVKASGIATMNGIYRYNADLNHTYCGPNNFSIKKEEDGSWSICDNITKYYTVRVDPMCQAPPPYGWTKENAGRDPIPQVLPLKSSSSTTVDEDITPEEDNPSFHFNKKEYEKDPDTYFYTHFFKFATYNHYIDVIQCIENGCPVNLIDPTTNNTALKIACKCGYLRMCQYLLNHEAIVDPTPSEYNCLQLAILNNRIEIVKCILPHCSSIINKQDPSGESPIHICSKNNFLDIVKLLVEESEVNLTIKNKNKTTPLHYSCISIQHYHLCQYILSRLNKDLEAINSEDINGDTPLHYAAKNNCDIIIQLLLDNLADVTKMNKDGETAYDIAKKYNFLRCLEVLEENDCNSTLDSLSSSYSNSYRKRKSSNKVEYPISITFYILYFKIDVFDYQDNKWGYYKTEYHPQAPPIFYTDSNENGMWYTYKTKYINGVTFYECEETGKTITKDPRTSEYFACPLSVYSPSLDVKPIKCPSPQILPLSKSDGGFNDPSGRDAVMYRKKCLRLEKEIDLLKKSMADNKKQYDEELVHLKDHQISELRKRDETIDEYYIRLKEMERSNNKKESPTNKDNNIKPNNEDKSNTKQLNEELEKIKKEKKEIEEKMKKEKEILIRQNNELKKRIVQQKSSPNSITSVSSSSSCSSDVNNSPNSPNMKNNKSEIEIIISPLFQEKFTLQSYSTLSNKTPIYSAIQKSNNAVRLIKYITCVKESQYQKYLPIWKMINNATTATFHYFNKTNVFYNKENETLLIVMPQLKPKSLQTINPKDLTIGEIKNIMNDVLKGLEFLEQKKLYHGNLKLSNIIWRSDNNLVITDYSQNLFTNYKHSSIIDKDSIDMYSIEKIRGVELDIKHDVWSVGCILYYLFSEKNKMPFTGATTHETMINILKVKYDELSNNSQVNSILKKIFIPNRKERLSIKELSVQIQKL